MRRISLYGSVIVVLMLYQHAVTSAAVSAAASRASASGGGGARRLRFTAAAAAAGGAARRVSSSAVSASAGTATASAAAADVRSRLATKAPYAWRVPTAGAPSVHELPDPPGCEPVFLYVLSRHGSRWPTATRAAQMHALAPLLQVGRDVCCPAAFLRRH
jgi:hypothetical protein